MQGQKSCSGAWGTAWGSKITTIKGGTLLQLFSTLNVKLLNDGRHTFEAGNKSSAIDLSFVQKTLVVSTQWKFKIGSVRKKIPKAQKIGWKHRCFGEEAFKHTWLYSRPQETWNDAIKLHQILENPFKLACDDAMPLRSNSSISVKWKHNRM